jgi:hypothetical protein
MAPITIAPKKLGATQKPKIPKGLGTNRIIALTHHDCQKINQTTWHKLGLAQIGVGTNWGWHKLGLAQIEAGTHWH